MSNYIELYSGPPKVGEDNFEDGPDFTSWKERILEYCEEHKITESEDIIAVAKNHLHHQAGIAYSICFYVSSLKKETNHKEWFDHFQYLCESSNDKNCSLMNKMSALISLNRDKHESFNTFFPKLCKLHAETLLVAKRKGMINAEIVITTMAETNLFKNLIITDDIAEAFDWRTSHFRKNLHQVNTEINKVINSEKANAFPEYVEKHKNEQGEIVIDLRIVDESKKTENNETASIEEAKCSKCHKSGHVTEECYFVLDEIGKRCIRCKKPGHSRSDCKTLKNNSKEKVNKDSTVIEKYRKLPDLSSYKIVTLPSKHFDDNRPFLPATVNGNKLYLLMANCSRVNLIKESFLKEAGIVNFQKRKVDLSNVYLFQLLYGDDLNVVGVIELTLHLTSDTYINVPFHVVDNFDFMFDGILGSTTFAKYSVVLYGDHIVLETAFHKN